ncbi:non-hydrolyzing UDP-N-acetylglucosamine 2-epimerase [Lacipirellula limnantheis]|uniref:UDP-N-acetylglucosamine 2-epimerase (non-hydrolyzing) n=1 Tax=Lacipirellula limnantheis TaxID=2528024 RepID=A0A517TYK3_9BACT|nr:UDP-N-acetylglucosamine 2-epimerase (non-hydrolyzing) [Lacipirellula limnantheis]QDT73449.1 UDP-N-acetylglucosamine 2-epimerase [Lacipirellula limnantheis]
MTAVRALLVIGTRPEAIKMAPVVQACRRSASGVEPIVCFTGQHAQMLAQVADYFGIVPDVDLNLMRLNQTLSGLTARALEGLDEAIGRYRPDCVVGQGDTTSVLAASMAAFYHRLPFVHVEAGLRTGDIQSPWPEEFNRRVTGLTAALHCAPTDRAAQNLLAERIPPQTVVVTGNTVIDALLWAVHHERQRDAVWRDKYAILGDRRMVLVTGHRRENFGDNFDAMCDAIKALSLRFGDVEFVYPVHLNPNAREPAFRILDGLANVHLIDPAPYPEFVWLMDRSHLILTDSGGVQEEAPTLKKPVLVMRESTERQEAVDAGVARLVGASKAAIICEVASLLTDAAAYARCQANTNPYGDGHAAERIVTLIHARRWHAAAT